MNILLDYLLLIFDFFFYLKGKIVRRDAILFIPHSGMCSVDHYDIINYKSDSALTFLRYILDNNLQPSKRIIVAISDNTDETKYKQLVAENYPKRSISFVKVFLTKKYSPFNKIRMRTEYNNQIISCSHIFTSITQDLSRLVNKKQVLCDLNYYTASLKNDIFEPGDPNFMDYKHVGKEYSYVFFPSELCDRLALAEFGSIPYKKFKYLGLCRNDNLKQEEQCEWLRTLISERLSYSLRTLVLYIPTHRDYEANNSAGNRSVLGFEYDKIGFEEFLRDNGIAIYCKLHPKQNALVVNTELPEGIVLHKASEEYGLTELMQASDVLLTDYTSGYFDYLLLDKPVIFNLYDLDLYRKNRGIPFEPITSVAAGDIVKNEEELKTALLSIEKNYSVYKQKRFFVRDLFFTYPDNKSCERIYNFIFNN